METKKNVFQELALSVWNFKSYVQFVNNTGGKVFGFSALLLAIYLLVTSIASAFGMLGGIADIWRELIAEVPNFVLENGELTVDGVYEMEGGASYLYVNTDTVISEAEAEAAFAKYRSAILIDAEKIAVQSSDKERQTISHNELQQLIGDGRYTKADLQRFLPYLYGIMAVLFIFLFVGRIAAFYLRIVAVSLPVIVIAYLMKMDYSYGKVFKLSVYTRTVPVLIRMLLVVTGLSIPFFWLIDIFISALYAYLALDAVKRETTPEVGWYV
ncbi:MAG: DUF1189 domain-containing protein [Lachnospiraceae bacterium]|nr:DUF1189 domain-containing protein [Lachnospiraceae bacterium]